MSFFNETEQSVNHGLNFRYSKHLPLASFTKEINIADAFSELPFSFSETEFESSVLRQRLPQTRIYVYDIYSNDFHLRLVSYFGSYWLLFYPLSIHESYIGITFSADYKLTGPKVNSSQEDNSVKIALSTARCVQIERVHSESLNLSSIIKREHETHPLRFLQFSEIKTVQKLDHLWAELPWNNLDGNIDTSDQEIVFWLDVLKDHFGWMKYKSESLPSQMENNSFLQKYRMNSYSLSEIQNFWEQIHFPAYALKLRQQIRQNPSEYIALALLAIKENFVWNELLSSLIIEALNKPLRSLVELLLLLKREIPLFIHKKNIDFKASSSLEAQQTIRQNNDTLMVGRVRHLKQEWTYLKIYTGFDFKVDQQVELKWYEELKKLQVRPLLWMPPLADPVLQYTEIKYKGIKFNIPLTWRQFEVHINSLRIKFLRKKNRFQLSVRLGKKDTIQVNSQSLCAEVTRYHTIYQTIHSFDQQDKKRSLIWLNRFGGSHYLADGMYLRGWIFDRKHILHNSVQLIKEGRRQSVLVGTNRLFRSSEKIWREQAAYKASGRYCETQQVVLEAKTGIVNKFLYTPAEQLISRLMIYSDEDLLPIFTTFEKFLRLVPECLPLKQFVQQPDKISLIVAKEFDGEVVDSKQPAGILKKVFGQKRDVWLIHPNRLNDLFIAFFGNK